ncbi:MAG: DUF3152 domain-containing protein [Bifidobacteriaceae bacterium]|jgi:hypothetical protein|nr:DUF3152 domain-containing protein [Bifidobacteriaceae bacterium]
MSAVSRSAVLGVATGVALVLVVWGSVYVWSPVGGASADSSMGPSVSVAATGSENYLDDAAAPAFEGMLGPSAEEFALRYGGKEPPPPVQDATGVGVLAPDGQAEVASAESIIELAPIKATVTYEIARRGDTTADLDAFAREVDQYLSDPLGWRAAGIEFKRVDSGGLITIWLAEDSTVPSFSSICSTGLSCSIGRNIIINEVRWVESAPPGVMDEVPVTEYRKMVVNHEVGHWLGHHNHSSCPGAGQVAPLMMQQSKGLNGCTFNPYPLPSELTAPDLFK